MLKSARMTTAARTALLATAGVVAMSACNGMTANVANGGGGLSSTPPPKIRLIGLTPHKKNVKPSQPIKVTFSQPLNASSPTPTITPSVKGHWTIAGQTETFHPAGAYPPSSTLTIDIPGGSDVVTSAAGSHVERAHHFQLTTPTPTVTFAEQILARLHYLPVSTTASDPTTAAAREKAIYSPPAGTFQWRWSSTPQSLRDLWSPTQANTVLYGALISFQHDHDMTVDGLLGPHTWAALLKADAASAVDPHTYTYISAQLAQSPQTLTLWRDGSTVLTSPTNGGVPGARTPDGTFPIYERFVSTTMSGTNPDGSHYSDPGVKWVNYFSGGSAVHEFPRASYGSPQSVGCLELPAAAAETVFNAVSYGTLVTVTGIAPGEE